MMEGSQQVLQDILTQRKQLGMKLTHDDPKECFYPFANDIKKMQKNTSKVMWDKIVSAYTSDSPPPHWRIVRIPMGKMAHLVHPTLHPHPPLPPQPLHPCL